MREPDTKYTASDGSAWHVAYDPPPIPTRRCDWGWYADDFDGPEDMRAGYAPSRSGAIAAIETWIEENPE